MWTTEHKTVAWQLWAAAGAGPQTERRQRAAAEYPSLALLLASPGPAADIDRGIDPAVVLRRHFSFTNDHLRPVRGLVGAGLVTPDLAQFLAAVSPSCMPRTAAEVEEIEHLVGTSWSALAISIINHPEHLRRAGTSTPVYRVQGYVYDTRRHLSMTVAARELDYLVRGPLEEAHALAPSDRAWNYFAHLTCFALPPLQVTGTAVQLRIERERAMLGRKHRSGLQVLLDRLPPEYRGLDAKGALDSIEAGLSSGALRPHFTERLLAQGLAPERAPRSSAEPPEPAAEEEFLIM